MAKKDYDQLAKDVVAHVGGKENILEVTNCMTRLRFVLKDDASANESALKQLKQVKGIMNRGGQYQVIIGTEVSDIAPVVREYIGAENVTATVEKSEAKEGSLFDRFFKVISGCITPMLGVMVGSGMIKGVLAILVTFGLITNTSGTYLALYAASNAVMYFMPVLIGFSAARVFKANQYTGAVIGAAIMYPTLLEAITLGEPLTFLRIPMQLINYSQSLLPAIAAVWAASHVEKFLKNTLPQILQLMFVPALTLAIIVPLTLLAIGPVMNLVSTGLSTVVLGIFNFSPIIGGILFGAFWQLMVVLGLHGAFIPVLINNLVTLGSDPINAVLGLTVWALAGVSLGYALKVKDKVEKSLGFGNLASCLCGVTEPTIYSIIIPNFKIFSAAWIGGGVAGGILAALGGKLYSFGGDGLFRIPAMINPAGLDISFYGFIACALLAMAVSAVIAYFLVPAEKSIKEY
ncbi:PTS transporter subunit EIIC [Trichococcus pasteurii]|uniref:Phosphotransferase system eiib cysteine phosphorylation site n=1 Tax=Trichococcus pasteurii TaxID=43064 RepID=A0A1W1IC41_9LACT|nr:PTS transporter subunit EIIC [Trichococcus pasteurii]SFE28017.1 PTS system, beta-glucosides-specific IIC component [Trichococcus pasteurii]SLM50566.1 phosphotransferase system eiib cysteine phosphorylation site [Trichococcus pasteurii]SSB91447.1 phosphotransferase system eiib cysteine phosphorylation site [Trichococcus pasteurii]